MGTTGLVELIPGLPDDVATECLLRLPFDQISTAASVCKDWNILIQQPEFWRRRKAAGFTQPLIAMAQARAIDSIKTHSDVGIPVPEYQLTLCDPCGFWSELPLIPELDQGLPMFCQIVGVGTKLVIIGGFQPVTWKTLSSVFVYDFLSATWRHGADIPGGQRSFFGCASDSDHTVLVAGGHDGSKNALKSAMVYDVSNDEWTNLPDMARERDECKCVFHRGSFHVIGGYCTEKQGSFERSAEVLNPETCLWDQLEDFLPDATSPRNCVSDCHESLIMFLEEADQVEGARDDDNKWGMIMAGRQPDEVCSGVCLTAWPGKLFVMGKTRASEHVSGYVKDLVNGVLTRIEIPRQHSGRTQSSCYLEI